VSVQPDLLMAMLASGCVSGVVLNVGAKECQSMCFAEGRPLIHTLKGKVHRCMSRLHVLPLTLTPNYLTF
jgi:hypothetical protein